MKKCKSKVGTVLVVIYLLFMIFFAFITYPCSSLFCDLHMIIYSAPGSIILNALVDTNGTERIWFGTILNVIVIYFMSYGIEKWYKGV